MPSRFQRKVDGIYQSSVHLIWDTWKNHPFRIPTLLMFSLLAVTVSAGLLIPPNSPINQHTEKAKANTYQFVPTAGNLVTGTEQNANSLLAASAEGVNTGSWKGTLADDNFHWQVTASDSGTPNLNMQLDLGAAKLANANMLLIQTEIDLDSASRALKVQICDWSSSTSVDAAADSQCTNGGWRSLMSQNASNADVDIALTTSAPFQWHIYDGYFSSGTGGGTTISTPLSNFTSNDTQPIRIRYWSDSDVVGSGDVAIDFLRATAFVDTIYHPAGVTNLNGSGGALTGTYANADVIGNSATAQQSTVTADAVRLEGAGTAGSVADYYVSFKNVRTYTGSNTFYFKADYSCSAATAGLDHKFAIRNFTAGTWEDLNSAAIACATADATNAWAKNNITPADYIDESASDEVRIRFYGDLNSTTTLRLDFAYLMLGSTNSDSAQCEITWGTGTATNCSNTRDLVGPGTASLFSVTAEDKSNTVDNDYYALDCPARVTAGECSAANIDFPVTVPTDGQIVVDHFAGKFAGDVIGTSNPDLATQMGVRDYSGTPTSTAGTGGWTLVGASSATSTQIYTDSITALAIGTYGMQINPDDHVDTTNNKMNIRMRSTAEGITSDNSNFDWDFAMVSIGWVVDSSHPTRNYQFAPTGDTLAAGSETARLGSTAAANTGVNTGGWQGTLNDDNLHWTVAGANVVGTNFDAQLNFTSARQNGANSLLIQTEFDTDLNISLNVQICDWSSSTSVDAAADSNCTNGGWRSLVSQTTGNADITYTGTTAVTLQWHIFDGYFTTGTTGGTAISTPLRNFFDATNGVKIRFFSTTQTNTNLDIDFIRIQPVIDTVYHPAGATNLNVSGGALAGTYANAHVVGNTASAQQSTTTADAGYLTGAGTAGSVADYYLTFKNIKTYTGMNTIYFKADYSCSANTAGLDHKFALYNFTTAAWSDLNSTAIACSTTDATHGWAKNNITIADYVNGGEARVRFYGDLNSTTTLRLDFAYLIVGSTNTDTANCGITFGSGTATNCSNTRDLDGPATANRFDNAAEDESATMGTGDSNAYYAFDNETTPDTTTEESATANISFPVTQPSNSSIVGENYAGRFSGCGNTGNACGAATLTVQLGFKDYSGFNQATGGWLQLGGTSASSTLAYTDTITALAINTYGQQVNPEDYIDTTNNRIDLKLRTTTPGTSATNVTTVWDFALVSLQWIEIGNTIDIAGDSSVTGLTVAVAVDGLLQVGKTATSAGGSCPCAWTISSVFVGKGRAVLVWHDAASDADESTGVTNYDGSGNISGLQLTAHTFSIGSTDDQTKTYAELALFDNDTDEDVMYKAVSDAITVDATSSYTDETLDILSGDTLSLGGSESLSTLNLTINGTLTSGGATAYTVSGNYENNGTFNEGTSTVTMNGVVSTTIDSGCSNTDTCTAENFYNLTVNKTDGSDANDNLTLTNFGLRIANTLTITDGELIQGTFNVRAEGSSAVSIAAAGKWTNTSTGDLKLGGTFANSGSATFNSNNGSQCVNAANDIVINSTSGGSQRAWSGGGTFTLYNLDVTDMTDSSITAYNSSFSNTTWSVGVCTIAITGTCKQYDQSTDCTDDLGNQIRVAINGSLQSQVDAVVDGAWSITSVAQPVNGDIITVFIDGETTDNEEAAAVTKYDGTGDVTGVILYYRHLNLGSDDSQTLTNTDISSYDNSVSGDEDIFFDVSAGNDLTVDSLGSYSDEELYTVNGNIYRPASGGGADVTTVHVENDGTWTADSNAITVNGNWQNDGTFNSDNSTVTFNSTSTGRTLSGTMTGSSGKFYNILFNGSGGGWTLSAALATTNNFDITNGTFDTHFIGSYAVTIGNNLTGNSGTWILEMRNSTFTISGNWDTSAVAADDTTIHYDTSTVIMDGTGTKTIKTGTSAPYQNHFYNLNVGQAAGKTTQLLETTTFGNILTLGAGTFDLNSKSLYYYGGNANPLSLSGSGTWGTGNGTLYLYGSANRNLPGFVYNSNFVSETAPGYYTIQTGDVTFTGDLRLACCSLASEFRTSTYNLNIGSLTMSDVTAILTAGSGTITVTGDWNNNAGATFTANSSTVDFSGSGTQLIRTGGTGTGKSFNNFTHSGSGTASLSTQNVQINGNLLNSGGTISGSVDVTVAGSVTGSGAITMSGSSTFLQRGDGSFNFGTTSGTNVWTFVNLTFGSTNGDGGGSSYTTQTGGSGGITVSSILRIGKSGDGFGTTLNAGNRTWTLSGTGGDPFQILASPAGALTASTSTFTYTGNALGNTTVQSATYCNLTINNALETYVLELATTASCDLTITAGTLDTVSGSNYGLTIGGNYSNSGTFTARLGTVTFNATDTGNTLSGTLSSTSAFYDLTFSGASGEWTPGASVLITHNLTMTNGSLLGTQDVTVNANVAGTSGTINLTGGTFEQRGDGSFNFGTTSGSTAWTFNNLTFGSTNGDGGGSSYTTQTGGSGGITVSSILRIGKSGDGFGTTLNAGNRTWTLSGTGGDPFQILASPAGALTASTSTFTYTGNNSSGNTTVQSGTYNHLTINNSSETYVLELATTTNGNLTITAGTLDVTGSHFALNIKGNYSNSGTFTAQNGTVTLSGTGTQTLSGAMTGSSAFYNLTITNNSGTSAADCERTSFVPSVDFDAGATATNNYTITTANVRVEYNSTATYTFNNINWNGQASGTRIYFRNSAGSGTWNLNVTAVGNAQTKVSYVNVSRSDASPGATIIASDGTNLDCSNNTNWQFDETLTLSLDSTSVSFGTINPGTMASNQTTTLTATSNAVNGYAIYAWSSQMMSMTRGVTTYTIPDWTGSNASPTTWASGAGFGYTTDDASLTGGTADRFTNGGPKYAAFTNSGPGNPVADRTAPATSAANTITYRLGTDAAQQSGTYTTTIIYVIAAQFP